MQQKLVSATKLQQHLIGILSATLVVTYVLWCIFLRQEVKGFADDNLQPLAGRVIYFVLINPLFFIMFGRLADEALLPHNHGDPKGRSQKPSWFIARIRCTLPNYLQPDADGITNLPLTYWGIVSATFLAGLGLVAYFATQDTSGSIQQVRMNIAIIVISFS
jgi:hypothetical protein